MRGLQDLQILVRTAERGSVSAAARELGVSPAVASLAIKRLEDELGCVLCLRSTRSLRLTQHGERFVAHARQMLASYQQALAELHPQAAPLREVLHLSMPSDFGRNLALGWLDDFQRVHPHVQLRLSLSDRLADMYREPVDLAIRFGLPPDSNLVALPLAECRRVLCAAPSYLARHGAPGCPQALAEHNCLCFIVGERLHNRWRFWRDGGEWVQQVAGDRSADDADVVRRWAVAGHGLVYKSQLDLAPDLATGRLLRVCPEWQGEPAPLYLLCADRRQLSPTVRQLREFLRERCLALLAGRAATDSMADKQG